MNLLTTLLVLPLGVGETTTTPVAAPATPPTTPPAALPAASGPSLHWGDYDGDGVLDVFVARPGDTDRLLRADASGFEDITDRVGLAESRGSRGALWLDVDQDGDPDLLTVSGIAPARLWRNDAGVFLDNSEQAGLDSELADLAIWTLDFDRDGLSDLQRRTAAGDRLLRNEGDGHFTEVELSELHQGLGLLLPSPAGPGAASAAGDVGLAEGERPSGRTLGVTAGTGAGGPTPSSSTQTGNQSAAAGTLTCANGVEDLLNPGNCVPLSTAPMLGAIYPLGLEFNIDSTGNVGIGTLSPTAQLDVAGEIKATTDVIAGHHVNAGGNVSALGSVTSEGDVFADMDVSAGADVNSGNNVIAGNDVIATADVVAGNDVSATFNVVAGKSVISNDYIQAAADVIAGTQLTALEPVNPPLFVISSAKVNSLNVDLLDGLSSEDFTQLGQSISGSEIVNGTITMSDLGHSSVSDLQLNTGAVTESKIQNGAVTQDKLASSAVGSTQIANGSIESLHFASPMTRNTGNPLLTLENSSSATQGDGLLATTGASSGVAIEGLATHTGSGVSYGVKGLSASSNGIGVWGRTNSSGEGVRGESLNGSGIAVYGWNRATSGIAEGVRGSSESTSGRAVYGRHEAISGSGQGVRGWTASSSGYGVYSSGAFASTGVKNFINPHPTDSSKQINFVCLEGNESGTYFRGTSRFTGGVAVVEVPEDFRLVSEEDGLTVQITVVGAPAQTWIETKNLDAIVVRSTADVEFDYFVNGVRRGYDEYQTIRENMAFVPTVRGIPYGTQYPDDLRQVLVENGTLNPDFTPNEATAASRGWALRDAEGDEGPE